MVNLSVMESNSSHEARAALDAVTSTQSRIAERLATPWWYHPILGLLLAQFVAVVAAHDEPRWLWGLSALILGLGCVALIWAYQAQTGLWVTQPAGRRSQLLLACHLGVVVLFAVLAVGFERTWVTVVCAIGVLLAVALLGPRYDAAVRRDMTEQA